MKKGGRKLRCVSPCLHEDRDKENDLRGQEREHTHADKKQLDGMNEKEGNFTEGNVSN